MGSTSDSPLQMPAKRFNEDEKAHRANNSALEQFGNIAFFGFVPIGGIVAFSGTSPPAGYLSCNGAAIKRLAYKALHNMAKEANYSDPWGPGDGSTTFNIPTRLQASRLFAGNATAGSTGLLLIRTGVY